MKYVRFVMVVLFGSLAMAGSSQAVEKSCGFYVNEYSGPAFIDFGWGYSAGGNVFQGGNGMSFEIGFNPAVFFVPGLIVAPYCGLAQQWGGNYNPDFLTALRDNYHVPDCYDDYNSRVSYLTDDERKDFESLTIARYRMENVLNGVTTGSSLGMYCGVILKYPTPWFPPIKIYYVDYSSGIYESSQSVGYYDPNYGSGRMYSLDNRRGWGVEIVAFRGYSLFEGDKELGNACIGSLSLFFQQMDFQDARIYNSEAESFPRRDVFFREFVRNEFWDKYKTEYILGIRLSLLNVL